MKRIATMIAAATLTAAAVSAQDQASGPVVMQHDIQAGHGMVFERRAFGVGGADVVEFVSAEANISGKTVKGAPYSAEAVTETTQTLMDGNRITSKNIAAMYRDSEGRTRREMTMPIPGMTDPPTFITINDPVSGASYHLDSKTKTARKLPVAADVLNFAPAMTTAIRGEVTGVGGGSQISIRQTRAPEAGIRVRSGGEPKTESLAKRAIDGVEVEGTKSTITIPAGEVGNEREILIVTERWYSPELQTVILSKHTDPRMGETSYRLTNLKRGDPHASLFQIPADYTLASDDPNVRFIRKIERSIR